MPKLYNSQSNFFKKIEINNNFTKFYFTRPVSSFRIIIENKDNFIFPQSYQTYENIKNNFVKFKIPAELKNEIKNDQLKINFFSNEMSVYLIYFDKNTFYTWHNHEAEEIYFVLSGNAKFESIGDTPEILSSNQSRFHKSFQPHSLSTEKEMCLSLVVWRDKLSSEVSVVKI